jgi:hypothetical protein
LITMYRYIRNCLMYHRTCLSINMFWLIKQLKNIYYKKLNMLINNWYFYPPSSSSSTPPSPFFITFFYQHCHSLLQHQTPKSVSGRSNFYDWAVENKKWSVLDNFQIWFFDGDYRFSTVSRSDFLWWWLILNSFQIWFYLDSSSIRK